MPVLKKRATLGNISAPTGGNVQSDQFRNLTDKIFEFANSAGVELGKEKAQLQHARGTLGENYAKLGSVGHWPEGPQRKAYRTTAQALLAQDKKDAESERGELETKWRGFINDSLDKWMPYVASNPDGDNPVDLLNPDEVGPYMGRVIDSVLEDPLNASIPKEFIEQHLREEGLGRLDGFVKNTSTTQRKAKREARDDFLYDRAANFEDVSDPAEFGVHSIRLRNMANVMGLEPDKARNKFITGWREELDKVAELASVDDRKGYASALQGIVDRAVPVLEAEHMGGFDVDALGVLNQYTKDLTTARIDNYYEEIVGRLYRDMYDGKLTAEGYERSMRTHNTEFIKGLREDLNAAGLLTNELDTYLGSESADAQSRWERINGDKPKQDSDRYDRLLKNREANIRHLIEQRQKEHGRDVELLFRQIERDGESVMQDAQYVQSLEDGLRETIRLQGGWSDYTDIGLKGDAYANSLFSMKMNDRGYAEVLIDSMLEWSVDDLTPGSDSPRTIAQVRRKIEEELLNYDMVRAQRIFKENPGEINKFHEAMMDRFLGVYNTLNEDIGRYIYRRQGVERPDDSVLRAKDSTPMDLMNYVIKLHDIYKDAQTDFGHEFEMPSEDAALVEDAISMLLSSRDEMGFTKGVARLFQQRPQLLKYLPETDDVVDAYISIGALSIPQEDYTPGMVARARPIYQHISPLSVEHDYMMMDGHQRAAFVGSTSVRMSDEIGSKADQLTKRIEAGEASAIRELQSHYINSKAIGSYKGQEWFNPLFKGRYYDISQLFRDDIVGLGFFMRGSKFASINGVNTKASLGIKGPAQMDEAKLRKIRDEIRDNVDSIENEITGHSIGLMLVGNTAFGDPIYAIGRGTAGKFEYMEDGDDGVLYGVISDDMFYTKTMEELAAPTFKGWQPDEFSP